MATIDEIRDEILKTIDHAFDLNIIDGPYVSVDLPFADYIEPIGITWMEVWLDDDPVTDDLTLEQWQEIHKKILEEVGMA